MNKVTIKPNLEADQTGCGVSEGWADTREDGVRVVETVGLYRVRVEVDMASPYRANPLASEIYVACGSYAQAEPAARVYAGLGSTPEHPVLVTVKSIEWVGRVVTKYAGEIP